MTFSKVSNFGKVTGIRKSQPKKAPAFRCRYLPATHPSSISSFRQVYVLSRKIFDEVCSVLLPLAVSGSLLLFRELWCSTD